MAITKETRNGMTARKLSTIGKIIQPTPGKEPGCRPCDQGGKTDQDYDLPR